MKLLKPFLLFLLGCALLAPAQLHAQVTTGTVNGRVTDAGTKLALGGVRVTVAGTALETYTSSNGDYVLRNVPAGEQTVGFDYVGYPATTQPVTVVAGQTNPLNFAFSEDVVRLDEFVIEGTIVGTARAINQQRAAATLTNIVASDEIGRFPDQNAAESLSRLPGVSVYRDQGEGRFVNVRGINYTLGNVTLDGSGLASPESGNRAIALDVVPSDSLGALEVSKVPTPDMTPEGLGGNINLRSKSPFDGGAFSAKLSGQTIYSALNGDGGYKFNGEVSTINADGKVGLLVGFSQQERDFGSYNVETDRWTRLDPPDGDTALSPFYSPVELQFRDYFVQRERTGFNGTIEFRPSDATRLWVRGNYNDFRDSEDRQNFFVPVSDDNVNNPVLKDDNTTGVVSGARRFARRARDREKLQDLMAFTAGGEFQLDRLTLDGQVAYSRGEENKNETQARFRRSTRDVSFRYNINGYNVSLSQLNTPANGAFEDPAAYNQFQRFDVESDFGRETEFNAMLNARYELNTANPAYLKFGAGLRQKEKQRDEEIYEFANNGSGLTFTNYTVAPSGYRFGPRIQRINTVAIVDFFEGNPALFEEDFADEFGNDYVVDEDVLSVYGMAGMTFGRLNVIAGVRLERTEVSTTGSITDEDLDLIGRETASSSYTDVLPGLHFRFDSSDRTVLRASYSQSIVRPAFGDMAFGRSIDTEDFEISERNPALKALNSNNLDVSLEHYMPSLGVFSVAAFHKDIKDFTFETNVGTRVIGTDTYDVFSTVNGNNGRIYGIEFAHQQQLRFLPAPLDNLSVQTNLTFSDSEADYGQGIKADFIGQSKMLGNVALTYEDRRFLVRVAVNFRDERLREDEDVSLNNTLIWIDDSVQVDLTMAYKINRNWELFAEVVNLTNEPFRVFSRGGPENQPKLFQQIEEYDYSIYAGVRWKL
jgi:TonB-dependent receptor